MLRDASRAASFAKRGLLVVLFAAATVVVAPSNLGGATTLVTVDGHSMEPLMHTGDLAIALRKPAYEPGDLVVFSVGGGLVIHRLIRRNADGSWQTKGDNKPAVDPWRIDRQNILGSYVFSVAGAGARMRWIQRQPMAIGGFAGLLTLALFVPLRRRGGSAPESAHAPERVDVWVATALTGLGSSGRSSRRRNCC